MASEYFGDETSQLLPVTSDNMSDSGNFDSVLELLTKASDRSLPESVMMMIPEAWQDNLNLTDSKKVNGFGILLVEMSFLSPPYHIFSFRHFMNIILV